MKKSRLLDEMARKVRAEAMRIEAARRETKRLILRRNAELAELEHSRDQASLAPAKA